MSIKYLLISLMLIYAGSSFAMDSSSDTPKKEVNSVLETCKKYSGIPSGFAKAYAAGWGITYAHEMGHCAFLKLFGAGPVKIHIDRVVPLSGYCKVKVSDIPNGVKGAIMYAAGPLCGLAAAYTLLKANTFYNVYKKNGENISDAVEETQCRPLINNSQSFPIQVISALSLRSNFDNLFPDCRDTNDNMDGNRLVKSLNIKPSKTAKKMIKSISNAGSIGLLVGLGYQIFKADVIDRNKEYKKPVFPKPSDNDHSFRKNESKI